MRFGAIISDLAFHYSIWNIEMLTRVAALENASGRNGLARRIKTWDSCPPSCQPFACA